MTAKCIKPIAELIKYNPSAAQERAEWTGEKLATVKPQAKRVAFGKKGAR